MFHNSKSASCHKNGGAGLNLLIVHQYLLPDDKSPVNTLNQFDRNIKPYVNHCTNRCFGMNGNIVRWRRLRNIYNIAFTTGVFMVLFGVISIAVQITLDPELFVLRSGQNTYVSRFWAQGIHFRYYRPKFRQLQRVISSTPSLYVITSDTALMSQH
jgi:hypothetical protein